MRPIQTLGEYGQIDVRVSSSVVRIVIDDASAEGAPTRAFASLSWEQTLALYRGLGDVLRDKQKREAKLHPSARVLGAALERSRSV